MRRLAAVALLCIAPLASAAAQASASDPRFDFIRTAASGGDVSADPQLASAALEEAIADTVVARLYGTPPLVPAEDRALMALAAAAPLLAPLAEKARSVAR